MSSKRTDFSGKVVLITGAARGHGHALAQAFAQRGSWVAANDISPLNLDELVRLGGGQIRVYSGPTGKMWRRRWVSRPS